jgi:hypothetical protein
MPVSACSANAHIGTPGMRLHMHALHTRLHLHIPHMFSSARFSTPSSAYLHTLASARLACHHFRSRQALVSACSVHFCSYTPCLRLHAPASTRHLMPARACLAYALYTCLHLHVPDTSASACRYTFHLHSHHAITTCHKILGIAGQHVFYANNSWYVNMHLIVSARIHWHVLH